MSENPRKRPRNCKDELCCLCRRKKSDKTKNYKPIPVVEIDDIESLKSQYAKWKNKTDYPSTITPGMTYLEEVFGAEDVPPLFWHYQSCRATFMSSFHLDRYTDIPSLIFEDDEMDVTEEESEDQAPPMILRSQMPKYIKGQHCVVCCLGVEAGKLCQALTYKAHKTLQELFETNPQMKIRLEHAFDAIAGDILYHPYHTLPEKSNAKGDDIPKSLTVYLCLKTDIKSRLRRGHAVLVSQCWERFQDLCATHNVSVPFYFIKRRQFFVNKICELIPEVLVIPKQGGEDCVLISSDLSMESIQTIADEEDNEQLKIPAYNDNEMLHMVHVALYLRQLILEHTINKTATLNEETAYAAIPEALYMFLALIFAGTDAIDDDGDNQDEENDDSEDPKARKLRTMILDTAQDLVFAVTGGKNIPPKQYAMGMTVSNLTRSKLLLQLLTKARQIIPPHKVSAADNAITKEVLKSLDEETGAVVPPNAVHGRPTQYGKDNIDTDKESQIVGHSAGWHGTQTSLYQIGPEIPIDVSEMHFDYTTTPVS